MSEGLKQPKKTVLRNDLLIILDNNRYLNKIKDSARLEDLIKYLNQLIFNSSKFFNELKINNSHLSWVDFKSKFSHGGLTHNDYLFIKNLLLEQLENLDNQKVYGSEFFVDKDSEDFFRFIVEKWLSKEEKISSALRCIYHTMWNKNPNNQFPYKIKGRTADFARDFWNPKFGNLFEINVANPRLNEHKTTSDYYDNKLEFYLAEFTGGEIPK